MQPIRKLLNSIVFSGFTDGMSLDHREKFLKAVARQNPKYVYKVAKGADGKLAIVHQFDLADDNVSKYLVLECVESQVNAIKGMSKKQAQDTLSALFPKQSHIRGQLDQPGIIVQPFNPSDVPPKIREQNLLAMQEGK